jgi:hypothetical protein
MENIVLENEDLFGGGEKITLNQKFRLQQKVSLENIQNSKKQHKQQ